jgi:hypothetical protein
MHILLLVGIATGALAIVALIIVLVQKISDHRYDKKSAQIKDRLRRKTKPVPITGRAANPRTTEE